MDIVYILVTHICSPFDISVMTVQHCSVLFWHHSKPIDDVSKCIMELVYILVTYIMQSISLISEMFSQFLIQNIMLHIHCQHMYVQSFLPQLEAGMYLQRLLFDLFLVIRFK
jgi:hypothetical protein